MNKIEAIVASKKKSLVVVTKKVNNIPKGFIFKIESVEGWSGTYWVFPKGKIGYGHNQCVNISCLTTATEEDLIAFNILNIKEELGI